MDGDDGELAMDSAEGGGQPSATGPARGAPAHRRSRTLALVVALVVVIAGGLLLLRAVQPRSHTCTVTGTAGPKAYSAEEAFDAWYAAGGAQEALRWTTEGQAGRPSTVAAPPHDDFKRTSETTWEWHYGGRSYVLVNVGPPFEPSGLGVVAVIGVNGCSEA